MPTILVSGAASGLGSAFVEAYQKDAENTIIALDLRRTALCLERVKVYTADISSQDSIDRFISNLEDTAIDLFIHSAGVRGLVPQAERENPGDVEACESIDTMDFDTMTRTLQINAVGTFMLIKALLPNLRMAVGSKVIVMSSRMGSIGKNQHPNRAAGGAYAYRASKAAMNAMVRSFAADVPGISFILCHPGRVQTRLVQWKEEGAISVEESVGGLLPLIEQWGQAESGRFYDRFGSVIEW